MSFIRKFYLGVDLDDVGYTPRTFLELTKSMKLNERDHA